MNVTMEGLSLYEVLGKFMPTGKDGTEILLSS